MCVYLFVSSLLPIFKMFSYPPSSPRDPNDSGAGDLWGVVRERSKYRTQDWAKYDPTYRRFLELGRPFF